MTQSVSSDEIKAAGGLDKWMRKQSGKAVPVVPPRKTPLPADKKNGQFAKLNNLEIPHPAKGRPPKDGFIGYDVERMNGLEARYAGHLEAQRRAGRIVFWKFGELKLRLADSTWYTTDFYIMFPDGHIEIHETKGFMRDDANVKIKSAAEKYPEFAFVLVKQVKGEWQFKRYRDQGGKKI